MPKPIDPAQEAKILEEAAHLYNALQLRLLGLEAGVAYAALIGCLARVLEQTHGEDALADLRKSCGLVSADLWDNIVANYQQRRPASTVTVEKVIEGKAN